MHLIQELLKEAGYETRAYSGRGMYGKYCLGVTSCHSESQILADLIKIILDDETLDKQDASDKLLELTESFCGPSTDSMGLDTIYYWRGIDAVLDLDDDEEEDDYPDWDEE